MMMDSDAGGSDNNNSNGNNKKPLTIFIEIENCISQLDQYIYQSYIERYHNNNPSLCKLPTPLEMLYKPKDYVLPKDLQFKLFTLFTEKTDLFSSTTFLQLVPHAKTILFEILNYEEKYKTIEIKLFTKLNPLSSTIYFKTLNKLNIPSLPLEIITNILTGKLNWFYSHFGTKKNWLKKITILDEDLLLNENNYFLNSADIIVMAYPLVNEKNNSLQKLVILQSDCNENYIKENFNTLQKEILTKTNRKLLTMKNWKDWKKCWELEFTLEDFVDKFQTSTVVNEIQQTIINQTFNEVPWFIHGSIDSVDIDKFYLFKDKLPPESDCNMFIRSSGTEDRNLFVLRTLDFKTPINNEKGYMSNVFKGLIDEANNALFTSYNLHLTKQLYPNPIIGKVQRLIPLKVVQTLMNILSKVRRSKPYRELSVKGLNVPSFKLKKLTVEEINFKNLMKPLTIDDFKYLAFRLGQTLALIEGVELFTKSDISNYFNELKPLLYRDDNVLYEEKINILNNFKEIFIDKIKYVISNRFSHLNILYLDLESMKKDNYKIEKNFFYLQCNGFICDLKDKEIRCLSYGLDHPLFTKELKDIPVSWPQIIVDSQPTSEHELLSNNDEDNNNIYIQLFKSKRESDLKEHPIMVSLLDWIKEDEDERNGTFNLERANNPKQILSSEILNLLDELKKEDDLSSSLLLKQVRQLNFENYYYVCEYNRKERKLNKIVFMRHKITNLPIVDNEILLEQNNLIHSII
ncbi:hypothetical protein ABK040_001684 [Willaertia magna]